MLAKKVVEAFCLNLWPVEQIILSIASIKELSTLQNTFHTNSK